MLFEKFLLVHFILRLVKKRIINSYSIDNQAIISF